LCLSCEGHVFDLNRPFAESADPAACPQCGMFDTRRIHTFSTRSQIPKLGARIAANEANKPAAPGAPGA
jgi:hypothetical protein